MNKNENNYKTQEIKTKIKVNKKDWYGYGLEPENELECKLSLLPYENKWIACMTCGGKHFWRIRQEFKEYGVGIIYYDILGDLYIKISENVKPEWFRQRGFEWM